MSAPRPADDADPILRTVGLRMVYHVGKIAVEALRGVDLEVRRGEFVAIMGPSGSGKSTLLHLLGGLAHPTDGRIVVDGDEISTTGDVERTRVRRDKIGFVFQRFNLFPTLTVRGNLEIARQVQGQPPPPLGRVRELLEMVGLPHKIEMKPLDLSGGEQQRVAVARALFNNPGVVLADEPSGNLDSAHAKELHQLFFELRKELGQTFVIVTHNEELAEMADQRLVMKDGVI